MRREELYLSDIVEAAEAIARFIAGIDREAFSSIMSAEFAKPPAAPDSAK